MGEGKPGEGNQEDVTIDWPMSWNSGNEFLFAHLLSLEGTLKPTFHTLGSIPRT